jgi:hypothetical protein
MSAASVKGSAYKFPKQGHGKVGKSPQLQLMQNGAMSRGKRKKARK